MDMHGFEITSIGSRCFNRHFLCRKSTLRYIGSPLDNMDNSGPRCLANVLSLIKNGFSQIHEKALEKKCRRNAVNIETGKPMDYFGYIYMGGELDGPVILPHFFDVPEGNMFLNDEDGWARWRHKVDLFMSAIADKSRRIVFSNARACHDGPDARAAMSADAESLARHLADEYGRTPENTLVLNFVICECGHIENDLDIPMARQVAVPMRQEDMNAKSDLYLDWTSGVYPDEFRRAIGL